MPNEAGTLEQWGDFISQYEQNLTTVKQHVDDVLNSSTATTAEKEQALSDYAEQKRYLDWLKGKYSEYESTGEVPADMTIDEDFSGDLYKYNNEIKIAEIPLDTTATTDTWHTIATVRRGTTQDFTIFQSEDLNLSVSVTAYRTEDATVKYKLQTGNYPALIIWAEGMNNMVATATGTWADATGYTPNAPGYDSRSFYAFGYISPPSSFSNIPTWNNSTSGLWGVKGFTPSGTDTPIRWIAVGVVSLSIDGTVDNPWDFYNDNLLPEDPENAVFPEGYEPPDPGSEDAPPEEGKPDRDATDEGEPPDQETVGWVDSSMTKFYVMTPQEFNTFQTYLSAAVQDSYSNPGDETKFLYKIGKLIKDGASNRYETAGNNFIGEYLVSCRMYPFDLKTSTTSTGSNYSAANQSSAITFGYNGASLDCSNWPDGVYPLNGVIQSCKYLSVDVPCRAGTQNVADATFLDFEPFTKYSIILPFLGEFELPGRSVVCATLDIYYQIDFSSGTIQAMVQARGGYNAASADYYEDKNPTTILQKTGVVGCSLSVTGNNIVKQGDQMVIAQMGVDRARVHSIISDVNANMPVAAKTAGGALTAGLEGGPEAGAAAWITSTATAKLDKVMNIPNRIEEIYGNYINMTAAGVNKTQASRDVPFILSQGTNIAPLMYLNQVAVRAQRAIAFYPPGFDHMYGYPKQNRMKIGALNGFVQTAAFDCSGIGGDTEPVPTEIEQKMIVDALKNGAYQNT